MDILFLTEQPFHQVGQNGKLLMFKPHLIIDKLVIAAVKLKWENS